MYKQYSKERIIIIKIIENGGKKMIGWVNFRPKGKTILWRFSRIEIGIGIKLKIRIIIIINEKFYLSMILNYIFIKYY